MHIAGTMQGDNVLGHTCNDDVLCSIVVEAWDDVQKRAEVQCKATGRK
jgi:hypothetical protein